VLPLNQPSKLYSIIQINLQSNLLQFLPAFSFYIQLQQPIASAYGSLHPQLLQLNIWLQQSRLFTSPIQSNPSYPTSINSLTQLQLPFQTHSNYPYFNQPNYNYLSFQNNSSNPI
jgi:hypothetical protein